MRSGRAIVVVLAVWTLGAQTSAFHSAIGDERAVQTHIRQKDIEAGAWTFKALRLAGQHLFDARFTVLDGAGRPGTTGDPNPTRRTFGGSPQFVRTSGPDANSCSACHNQPRSGGAGDFVANVFVGLQNQEPVVLTVEPLLSAERNSTSLFGAGAIEMLAREMTADLHQARDSAIREARAAEQSVRVELKTKGISFGFLTATREGSVRAQEIAGVDKDLVIRPWSQKGVVTSLRTFTVTALNQHHGMQAVERYGIRLTGSEDFDRDGVKDELTEGDVTALVVYQASLPVPGQVLPHSPGDRRAVEEGERLFSATGCNVCHVPQLVLNRPVFSEPGPYNLEGTMRLIEAVKPFEFDLTRQLQAPRLERRRDGRAVVRAFTDLKRHRICDTEKPFYCNENLGQGGFAPTDEFLTKRLWDVGSTSPYGHRGDLTTLREAILHHGGEARDARLAFESLTSDGQRMIIAFLKTLQILPEGSQRVVGR